ncbi:MAG TPA: hypothetical protein VGS22_27235 [Thermoanaerobaculia bacterium]|nr:hypothetical protein [Thermoanaerobaculia bacterium]
MNDSATPNNLTVHFLTGITQPDGSTWSMPLSDYILVNTPLFNDLVGRIQGLKLPTLGRLEWEYGFYRFPATSAPERGPWLTSSRGVTVRRKKTAAGGVEGTWTYAWATATIRTVIARRSPIRRQLRFVMALTPSTGRTL